MNIKRTPNAVFVAFWLQTWTKVVTRLSETNAFELTIILCFSTENTFFIYSQLIPPNNVAYRFVDVYLFGNIEKGGRRGYLSRGETEEKLGKI